MTDTGVRSRIGSVEVLAGFLVLILLARGLLGDVLGTPIVQTWTTVFVSIVLQAVPFLVFGVTLSAAIAVFVPREFFAKALPKHPALAVPAAAATGMVLPGCECGSVPVAGALVRKGVTPAAALAFLLAAPALNPVVLAATAIAFPDRPSMVFARAAAGLAASVVMGWLWLGLGRTEWIKLPEHAHGDTRWRAFAGAAGHDLVHAGGFLVVGAMAAATLNVLIPGRWLQAVADDPVLGVLALSLLAVLLSICSEADAFVAASLTQFSLTARLAFLVVGPMVDLKLFAMQAGTFGRRFAARFAPTTFVVALACAAVTGTVLW
ncbi:permease [Amycolatopsis japonica]|uniref:permease n=1 Tax=Amycolatopsis japonica TaxID=208439 RepID=UPI00332A9D8B